MQVYTRRSGLVRGAANRRINRRALAAAIETKLPEAIQDMIGNYLPPQSRGNYRRYIMPRRIYRRRGLNPSMGRSQYPRRGNSIRRPLVYRRNFRTVRRR